MGIMSWDLDGSGFNTAPLVRGARLTVCCEYPDTPLEPTEVSFRLSPSYGPSHGTLRTTKPALDPFVPAAVMSTESDTTVSARIRPAVVTEIAP